MHLTDNYYLLLLYIHNNLRKAGSSWFAMRSWYEFPANPEFQGKGKPVCKMCEQVLRCGAGTSLNWPCINLSAKPNRVGIEHIATITTAAWENVLAPAGGRKDKIQKDTKLGQCPGASTSKPHLQSILTGQYLFPSLSGIQSCHNLLSKCAFNYTWHCYPGNYL